MRGTFLWGTVASMLSVTPILSADDGKTEQQKDRATIKSIYDLEVQDIAGKTVNLSQYAGKVLLIVNVASECGLTDRNYTKLQPLYEKYREAGLRILAFPANNFGSQEPGTNEQIKKFCRTKYNVTYDLFAKVSVAGEDICPLYEFLTQDAGEQVAGKVPWNFQKYLVGRDGTVLAVFHPRIDPDDKRVTSKVEEALEASVREASHP